MTKNEEIYNQIIELLKKVKINPKEKECHIFLGFFEDKTQDDVYVTTSGIAGNPVALMNCLLGACDSEPELITILINVLGILEQRAAQDDQSPVNPLDVN